MKTDLLKKSINNFRQVCSDPDNAISIIDGGLAVISLWNPQLGVILSILSSSLKIGVNTFSQKKMENRMQKIVETIEKIWYLQQKGNTNYEAALICPELFRNILIIEDDNRVKEHLALIEMLFSSEKMNFDDLAEALRLINQLSSIEYKILKLLPSEKTKWEDILKITEIYNLYNTEVERLTAAFLSLINMNLVIRKLIIRRNGGPELGTINYNDKDEYIMLSAYGKMFLKTMREIKSEACTEIHRDDLEANWKLLSNGEEYFKIEPLK